MAVHRGGGTRRLTSLASFAGAIAVITVVFAVQSDEGDGSRGSGWIAGLLLILAPLLAAGVARSVASSGLLRPVGGVAAVLGSLASILHVAVAIDGRGTAGWAYGAPALLSSALLIAAVARGPDLARPDRAGLGGRTPVPPQPTPEPDVMDGPPLDVLSPLTEAREHAGKAFMAWLIILAAGLVVSIPVLRVLGWPAVASRLEARVVHVHPVGEQVAVTFEAQDVDGTLHWTYVVEASNWELGERNVAYLDEDGRVHEDQQFGLVGVPLFLPIWLVVMLGAIAGRRLMGLLVATWDVGHEGPDPPRLGYAAVIDADRRTWRPLVAIWEHDPTRATRLAKPDAVYLADDETSEDLQTSASDVVVRRAWIDTGPWDRSTPRWVGFEDGVAVPHRRSFLGRWYVRIITRGASVNSVRDLRHGPPRAGGGGEPRSRRPAKRRHDLGRMVLWRVLALAAGIAFTFAFTPDGRTVQRGRFPVAPRIDPGLVPSVDRPSYAPLVDSRAWV